MYTLFTEYTHLGDKVEGGIKIIPGMQVTGNFCVVSLGQIDSTLAFFRLGLKNKNEKNCS